ncbi:MAG: hypothetical protein ACU0B7_14525 [Paracoccaceae bacterium]
MTCRFRPFFAIALALLLVLTAQSMAAARGMSGVSGSVVLCTGTGPVTILTDADGQPVGPAHICPDCTLSLIVALAGDAPLVLHPIGRAEALKAVGRSVLLHRIAQPFSARDPPAVV